MACRTQERRAVAATDRETKDRAGMDGEGLGAVDMVLYHRSGAGISTGIFVRDHLRGPTRRGASSTRVTSIVIGSGHRGEPGRSDEVGDGRRQRSTTAELGGGDGGSCSSIDCPAIAIKLFRLSRAAVPRYTQDYSPSHCAVRSRVSTGLADVILSFDQPA